MIETNVPCAHILVVGDLNEAAWSYVREYYSGKEIKQMGKPHTLSAAKQIQGEACVGHDIVIGDIEITDAQLVLLRDMVRHARVDVVKVVDSIDGLQMVRAVGIQWSIIDTQTVYIAA